MNWNALIPTVKNITADQTRSLLERYPLERFQLLDVRQPKEYEQAHLPGATLIPLGELADRVEELDRNKEVVVYCRSGVRSRSACQILEAAGFTQVMNMTGGIIAWQGHTAGGGEDLGIELFAGSDYSSAVSLAMAMEQGLKRVYLLLADRSDDDSNRDLLTAMARLEDGHMARLKSAHPTVDSTTVIEQEKGEGGLDINRFLATYGDELKSIEAILHAAMTFEAQAYDLYSRLARRESGPELRAFYQEMAAEEQTHLRRLARELDSRLA